MSEIPPTYIPCANGEFVQSDCLFRIVGSLIEILGHPAMRLTPADARRAAQTLWAMSDAIEGKENPPMNKTPLGSFVRCIPHVISHEGGYVNHPSDPGGETKYGISKRSYPHLDIAALTLDEATSIYERDYWLTVNAHRFPAGVSLLLFDAAVNKGQVMAVQLLQKALQVTTDGIPGPATQAAAFAQMPDIISRYAAERARYYALLHTIRAFGRGWYRRLFDLYALAMSWHA